MHVACKQVCKGLDVAQIGTGNAKRELWQAMLERIGDRAVPIEKACKSSTSTRQVGWRHGFNVQAQASTMQLQKAC
jgi:hypothetical protein